MSPRQRAVATLRRHYYPVIFLIIVAFLLSTTHPHLPHIVRLTALRTTPFRASCVYVMGHQNNEGLGQTLLRNQFSIYIAELLSSRLQFPEHVTQHGYNLADFFDCCIPPSSVGKPSTPQIPEQCVLRKKNLLLRNCARGDCACLKRATFKYVLPLAWRCDIIGVEHDGFKTQEYSGCIPNALKRYFGGPNRWPRPYDAIHHRQGDLQKEHNTNNEWLYMLNNIVSFMCKHSDRDIIIITQGEPTVPKCQNRVVLAGNTTERDAFPIMQHARWVGVENSGFGIAMLEISNPERVLMDTFVMQWYDWLTNPEWTVFNSAGGVFSFASGTEAIAAKYAGAGLEVRTIRSPDLKKFDKFDSEVPPRRWETDALPKEKGT
ncbi:unnamed protein product [Agarophyton chilense]